ncbi:hypothetical protein FisN_16Lh283 [Fistulifera solaris]|uniref:MYND-type domain-containing protein n=1 Tax=Fistulifera solaris TaxID=1519565 RepID=A0A1Z5KNW0_FISSO|nr:hypothetical protein FisN_16Lh283 [Fistulifera solaris]|eukprot:GAX28014.1 hypothetical protein FisN_16Lh283 [Fistulifera solaris]
MNSKDCFHFRPLQRDAIEAEIATIRSVEQQLEEEWRLESLKYEETITVPHCSHPVARRNYFNSEGIVQDTSLYPYHDFYYPLIDAYDCLYPFEEEHPIPKDALRPQPDQRHEMRSLYHRIQQPEENHFEFCRSCFFANPVLRATAGMLPFGGEELYTSPDSVIQCILLEQGRELSSQWSPATRPRSLYDGQHEFWTQMRDMFFQGKTLAENFNFQIPISTRLPRELKWNILLRLLRHALSEVQRDYYMALTILTRLSREQALDDVAILRKVLLIVNSECVECDNLCDIGEKDHDCGEWSAFLNGLHLTIGLGITIMTEEHAVTVASFVRSRYLDEFGHLLIESQPLEKQRRARLKRVVAALRTEDRPSSLHIQLVEILFRALGTRANLERRRCQEAIKRVRVSSDILGTFLSSYWNCVRALVDLGDATVEMLPDNEPYFTLASEAVKNTAYGFMDRVSPPPNRVNDLEHIEEGSSYLFGEHPDIYPSLISSTRYLDHVLQKRKQVLSITRHGVATRIDSESISAILDLERPDKVLKTVRSLFVRDMVDVRLSRMGYGDFVVWCGFPLNIDDPIMFWHEYQYPVEDEDEDNSAGSEDDSDAEFDPWIDDENGRGLSLSQLQSRYDFSVLVALRARQAPWKPTLHYTFSHSFQRTIKELFLCTHRLRIPNEVVLRILPFIDRRWWPDRQPECWSYTCQLNAITKDQQRQRQEEDGDPSHNEIAKPFLVCPGCGTACYCSRKCLKEDLKGGHRRLCCLPPYKRSAIEESVLFNKVFKENIPEPLVDDEIVGSGVSGHEMQVDNVSKSEVVANDANVDDEDGSWESFDSDEDDESLTTTIDLTEIISNYFSKS